MFFGTLGVKNMNTQILITYVCLNLPWPFCYPQTYTIYLHFFWFKRLRMEFDLFFYFKYSREHENHEYKRVLFLQCHTTYQNY